jgi:hypothetical protein
LRLTAAPRLNPDVYQHSLDAICHVDEEPLLFREQEGLFSMPNAQNLSSEALATDAVSGAAALSICESLLLALIDHDVLPEREIIGILHDAATAHANHPVNGPGAAFHAKVAALINSIIDSGNSVRRSGT